jgi:hypothetical protein
VLKKAHCGHHMKKCVFGKESEFFLSVGLDFSTKIFCRSASAPWCTLHSIGEGAACVRASMNTPVLVCGAVSARVRAHTAVQRVCLRRTYTWRL